MSAPEAEIKADDYIQHHKGRRKIEKPYLPLLSLLDIIGGTCSTCSRLFCIFSGFVHLFYHQLRVVGKVFPYITKSLLLLSSELIIDIGNSLTCRIPYVFCVLALYAQQVQLPPVQLVELCEHILHKALLYHEQVFYRSQQYRYFRAVPCFV